VPEAIELLDKIGAKCGFAEAYYQQALGKVSLLP
jgi:hypothetical protein